MMGVTSVFVAPKLSNFQLQATWRFLTLSRVTRSAAEYPVLPASEEYAGHWPLCAPFCAARGRTTANAAMSKPGYTYRSTRDMPISLTWQFCALENLQHGTSDFEIVSIGRTGSLAPIPHHNYALRIVCGVADIDQPVGL